MRISSTVPVSTTFASSSRRSSARSGHVPSAPGRARTATTRSSSGCRRAQRDGRGLAMARAEAAEGCRSKRGGRAVPGTGLDRTGRSSREAVGAREAGRGRDPGGTTPSRPRPAPAPGPPVARRPVPAANKAPGQRRRAEAGPGEGGGRAGSGRGGWWDWSGRGRAVPGAPSSAAHPPRTPLPRPHGRLLPPGNAAEVGLMHNLEAT